MVKYKVKCLNCGKEVTGWTLTCSCNSLLRAYYNNAFEVKNLPGMWKYLDWLPCEKPLDTKVGPVTYKSEGLAKELGLNNLYISFNGYWPEKSAYNMTCSFKDLEASPTVSRALDHGVKALLISSAGNTARAFAHVSNITGFEIYLLVPEAYLFRMWTPGKPNENIHLIAVKGDYLDAITLRNQYSEVKGIPIEGGVKNVARRDGMGTVMLDGACAIGKIPKHYFQAIGSGVGAIACWEMALRLRENGWQNWTKLNLSQNSPFVPIYHAWRAGRGEVLPEDMQNAEESIKEVYSTVLTNRKPPYSVKGGVYDALKDTNGEMYAVTNVEAEEAGKVFESSEGIDPLPAANIAIASLIQAVNENKIETNDTILLNVTGGGLKRLKEDYELNYIKPKIVVENIQDLSNFNL